MTSDRTGARLLRVAGWMIATAAALLASACATTSMIDGPTALDGRDLDTAIAYYGAFDARLDVAGKTYYVWRRTVAVDGRSIGCELRAEVAFRKQIRSTQLEGFPPACVAFSVQFTALPETRRGEPAAIREADATPMPAYRPATGCAGCRPVGSPTVTASASPDRRD